MQSKLAQAEHVALTSDLWTSKANEPIITITSHFVDENNKLHSCVLDTVGFDDDHSGNNLCTYFKAATAKWEIENKVNSIVTDNATNIANAVEYSGFESMKCTGHTLNLSAKDIIDNCNYDKIQALLSKCRKLVGHFKRSSKAQQKLTRIQERLSMKQHKMIQEVINY